MTEVKWNKLNHFLFMDDLKLSGSNEKEAERSTNTVRVFKEENYRRIRKLTSSKLNGGNVITAINSRAVSYVRYSAGIINWTREELRRMDRKTRKIMSIN